MLRSFEPQEPVPGAVCVRGWVRVHVGGCVRPFVCEGVWVGVFVSV